MAKEVTETTMTIDPIKKTQLNLHLVGDSDLILNKKSLSFTREEIFKQSNPKGTKIPDTIAQKGNYNLYEKLITSVTWEKPIPEYDDYSLYTKEMWEDLMQNNRPCILSKAFISSFYECFVTHFKDSTGRNGTDFKRSVSLRGYKHPVDFTSVTYSQHLTPNTGITKTNVLAQHNIFSGWSCNLDLTIVQSVFPVKTVIEIINTTGEFIGIGTKRAEGWGHYHIDDVEVMEVLK